MRERERENTTAAKEYSTWCGKFAAIFIWNAPTMKDVISCQPVFVLRKHVFWVVAPFGWVVGSRLFEGTYLLHLQGYEFVYLLITLKTTAVCFCFSPQQLREEVIQLPTTTIQKTVKWRNTQWNKNHCVCIVKNTFLFYYFIFLIHCVFMMMMIIITINCNWVVIRWQWLFYTYTKYEIGY